MKYSFLLLLITSIIFLSCGDDAPEDMTAYNPEAFAYDIGGGNWEVNASTRVKGFTQNENEEQYSIHLTYSADLVKNIGDTIKNVYEGVVEKSDNESFMDVPLEVQFELDSTYKAGDYEVVFWVNDVLSGRSAKSFVKFKLEE